MAVFPAALQTLADGSALTVLETVVSGIPYVENVEGYDEDFTQDTQTLTRTCDVDWDLRQFFRADMMGTTRFVPGAQVGGIQTNISRQLPEQHPLYPWLYVDDCKLIGGIGVPPTDQTTIAKVLSSSVVYPAEMMDPSFAIKFALARIAVSYKDRNYFIVDDTNCPSTPLTGEMNRYITRLPRFATENLSIPGIEGTGKLQWADTVNDAQHRGVATEGATVPVTFEELHYVWHQLPFLPAEYWTPFANRVNIDLFDGIYDPGTILFMGWSPERRYHTGNGDVAWDVTLTFGYRPTGWNYFPRISGSLTGFVLPHAGNPNGNPGVSGEFGFYLRSFDGTNTWLTPNNNSNFVFGPAYLNSLFIFPTQNPVVDW